MDKEKKQQLLVEVLTQIDVLSVVYNKDEIDELIKDLENEASSYEAIGFVYNKPGDYSDTVNLYGRRLKQLKIFKELLDAVQSTHQ